MRKVIEDDENANMVDAVENLANAVLAVRKAIIPPSSLSTMDASGTHVDSLTEAIMGVTAGLMAIAEAIRDH